MPEIYNVPYELSYYEYVMVLLQSVVAEKSGVSKLALGLVSFSSVALYCAGIDFRRQNLTYVDVRFGRLKSIPAQ